MPEYLETNWSDVKNNYNAEPLRKELLQLINYANKEGFTVSEIYHALHMFVDETMYDYEVCEEYKED
jgi:hypothetical protein